MTFFSANNIFFYTVLRTKKFLKNAIFQNDFLKNLELFQIESIINCMYPVEFEEDSLIVCEGEIGNVVYIIEGEEEKTVRSEIFKSLLFYDL